MSVDLSGPLQSFIMIVLSILLPLLVKVLLVGVVFKLVIRVVTYTETQISAGNLEQLRAVVKLFVAAAEQSGLKDALLQDGAAKKDWVITEVQAYLNAHGLSQIDVRLLSNIIEAAVLDLKRNQPLALVEAVSLPPGSAPPPVVTGAITSSI